MPSKFVKKCSILYSDFRRKIGQHQQKAKLNNVGKENLCLRTDNPLEEEPGSQEHLNFLEALVPAPDQTLQSLPQDKDTELVLPLSLHHGLCESLGLA